MQTTLQAANGKKVFWKGKGRMELSGYVTADNSALDHDMLHILDDFYRRQTLLPADKDDSRAVEVFISAPSGTILDDLPDTLLEEMAWALLCRPSHELLVQPLHISIDTDCNGLIEHPSDRYIQEVMKTGFLAVAGKRGLFSKRTRVLANSKGAFFLHAALKSETVFSYSAVRITSPMNIRQRLVSDIKRKIPAPLKSRILQIYRGMMMIAGKKDFTPGAVQDPSLARRKNWESVYPVLKIKSKPMDTGDRVPVLIAMHWLELGGAEKFAVDLIKSLPKDKYAFYVTCDVPSPNTWKKELAGFVQEIWELPVFLPDSMAHTFYKEFIRTRKIKLLHIHHGVKVYQSLFYLRRFYPDLVILDSLHIIEMPPNIGGYPEYAGRDLSPLMNHHHVISDKLKHFLVQRWQVPEEKITRVYLNVDHEYFNPDIIQKHFVRSRFNIPDDALLIGFIGRFVVQKQPLVFVEMAKRLKDQIQQAGHDVFFVMVGSGPLKGAIEKKIGQDELSRVLFIHEEVVDTRPVYRDIDLLVMPSENEGLALVSYEAMAMKVPVVFSDVGAQSELQDSRYLVSPEEGDQASAFADKTMPLIRDIDQLRQSGEALRSYILEHHRASDTIKEMASLYDRLLE